MQALNLFKRLKKRKSPGADNITNEHIINGGPPLLRCLRQLYSNIFEFGSIPDKCKVGTIIPIHKPGKGEIHQIATGPLLYYLQSTSFSKEFSSKGCNTGPFKKENTSQILNKRPTKSTRGHLLYPLICRKLYLTTLG